MKKIYIIRHVDYERLGWIPEVLDELGLPFESICLPAADGFPELSALSGVISMGGPMSAYHIEQYPFLEQEMAFDRELVNHQIPFLGICLGAQLMAQAFGAKVTPQEMEVGWIPLQKTQEAQEDVVFKDLDVPQLFQLHGDYFELPKQACRLLKSENCPNQAFRMAKGVYGIQFHPETHPLMLESVIDEYGLRLNEKQMQCIHHNVQENFLKGRAFLKELLNRIFS